MKNFIKFLLVYTGYIILFTAMKVLDVYLGKPSNEHWYFYILFYIVPFGIYGWNVSKLTYLVDVYYQKRKYKPLANLTKGDLIKIYYGDGIKTATVYDNHPQCEQIELVVYDWLVRNDINRNYKSYIFDDYDILNGRY